jgi:hypothetical protein
VRAGERIGAPNRDVSRFDQTLVSLSDRVDGVLALFLLTLTELR